ncbi:unnamed protein product [Adineta steineri]|uniref:Tetraspanin n=1 Tax=Adineta steineri TaxID=433720 RepID=A0A813QDL6_9BILA|nr:unnamed protein product [Adineta steineri]CAF0766256.1 unnamed protein product [Adineta steineri]CAF0923522.1 unnamed protein product [Adineta steineri]
MNAKGLPWACIGVSFLTLVMSIILLVTASVFTNHSSYLQHYFGICFSMSIFTLVITSLGIIFACGLMYVAFRRFPALTTLFSGLLCFVALLSLIVCIFLLIARPHLRDRSMKNTKSMMSDYNDSDFLRSSKQIMGRVQQRYQCCGADRALDWQVRFPDNSSTPDSCCFTETTGCGKDALIGQNKIYLRGCAEPLAAHYRTRYSTLVGMHFTLIGLCLASAALGLAWERHIRQEYQLM